MQSGDPAHAWFVLARTAHAEGHEDRAIRGYAESLRRSVKAGNFALAIEVLSAASDPELLRRADLEARCRRLLQLLQDLPEGREQ